MRVRITGDSTASSTKHCIEIFEQTNAVVTTTHYGSTIDEAIGRAVNHYKSLLGNLESELKKLGVFNDKHSNS